MFLSWLTSVTFHEKKILHKLYIKGLLYHGRYIDDIFLLFKGSREALNEILPLIEPEGLETEWNVSDKSTSYLTCTRPINQLLNSL